MFLPLMMSAQDVLTPQQQLEKAQKELEQAKKAVEDAKAAAEKAKKEQSGDTELKPSLSHEPVTLPAIGGKPVVVGEPEQKQGWQVPEAEKTTGKKAEKTTSSAKLANGVALKDDPKYLEGALTTDAYGKIEFTLNTDANGKSAQQIYDIVYKYMSQLVQNEDNIQSRIALVNPTEKSIVTSMDEWLQFSKSFFSLDRTEFKYQLIATISDNSLKLTMTRLYYIYEADRSTGFQESGEKVICDDMALTKKKNALSRVYGKFRKKTIDRKDQIFKEITQWVKQ